MYTKMDIIFELTPGDEYKTRCGEIFLSKRGYLLFHCNLCKDKYGDYNDFWTHILSSHVLPGSASSENSDEEELEGKAFDDLIENSVENIEVKEEIVLDDLITVQEAVSERIENASDEKPTNFQNEDLTDERLGTEEEESSRRTSSSVVIDNSKDDDVISSKTSDPDLKKFKCKQCGAAFKVKCNLRTHLLRHSGEKNYQCVECGKAFVTPTDLNTHLRRHRNERPFLCQECGDTFVTSGSLSQHIKRRHKNLKNFHCSECSKSFYAKAMLHDHQFVHKRDVKPHTCLICNSSFPRLKSLMSHMKLHSNKREYICELCGEGFNQRPGLFSHKRHKHKI